MNEDYDAYLRVWCALTDVDLPLPKGCMWELRMALAKAFLGNDDTNAVRHLRKAIEAAKEG